MQAKPPVASKKQAEADGTVIRSFVLFRLFQLIKQAAFRVVLAVALLGFDEVSFPQIVQSPADGGLRELQLLCNRRDRRPAFAVLVGTVVKINVHRYSAVRQV